MLANDLLLLFLDFSVVSNHPTPLNDVELNQVSFTFNSDV